MKAPSTPPRRRSLFVRGYDRPLIEGRIVNRSRYSSNRSRLLFVFATVAVLLFVRFYSIGYGAAQKRHTLAEDDAAIRSTRGEESSEPAEELPTRNEPEADAFKPKKIAVAVTVTRDGPYLDGAAVLQHSIRMTRSRHSIDMVAIVHAGVQTTRPGLEALGFRIVEFQPPVNSKDIKGKHLRETIDKSGCCGALELLKICAWKLEEYDWVVSMDMDAIWLQSLDSLFERDIPKGGFLFTYDFAMDNPGSKAPPVQGGFIAVRPSTATYDNLVRIVLEGDFRANTGWGGTNIGWCWGGQTVQGLLAYYANIIEPTLAFPVDPCEYNSMASTKICRRVDYNLVKSIHYTVCQKPWECRQGDNNICAKFLHAWWMVRNDLELANGLSPTGRCCHARSKYCKNSHYVDINIRKMKALPMSDIKNQPIVGHIVKIPLDLPSRQAQDD